MAAGEPLGRQPLFQMRTEDARLDAGAEVLPVDPFDGVHAAHVHRDDGARLIRRQLQGATDARPAAVGDEADVVGLGQLDQLLDVGLRLWVDDEIDDALQVGVEHLVDLVGRGLAVAVQQALAAVVGELVGREGGGQRGVEGGVALWLRHGLVGAFRLDVAQVNGHAQHLLDEGDEVGHIVAADSVAVAGHLDRAVGVDDETGVFIAPAVAPDGLVQGSRGFVQ